MPPPLLDLRGIALNALSLSPDRAFVGVGGRRVLKLVRLDNLSGRCTSVTDLRGGGKLATNDIKFHPRLPATLATAATNGAVVLWNLEQKGPGYMRVLKDHARTVNRVCWHRSDAHILLSGSQDGSVKLWDVRTKASSSTFRLRAEQVRDVQFSPFHSSWFAAAYESGMVRIWDARRPAHAAFRLHAHNGLVMALDWHPSERGTLATGGRDRNIHVWNLGGCLARADDASRCPEAAGPHTPVHSVQTIASVSQIRWRPRHPSQIASCSSVWDASIHLWDVECPNIPLASCSAHKDVSTGFLWLNDQDLLNAGHDRGNNHDSAMPAEGSSTTGFAGPGGGGGRDGGDRKLVREALFEPQRRALHVPDGQDECASATNAWNALISCAKDGTVRVHRLDSDARKSMKRIRTSCLAVGATSLVAGFDPIDRSASLLGRREYDRPLVGGRGSEQTRDDRGTLRANTLRYVRGVLHEVMVRNCGGRPHVLGGGLLGFDVARFRALATRVWFHCSFAATSVAPHPRRRGSVRHSMRTLATLCAHNAEVAIDVGATSISETWRILGHLFFPPPPTLTGPGDSPHAAIALATKAAGALAAHSRNTYAPSVLEQGDDVGPGKTLSDTGSEDAEKEEEEEREEEDGDLVDIDDFDGGRGGRGITGTAKSADGGSSDSSAMTGGAAASERQSTSDGEGNGDSRECDDNVEGGSTGAGGAGGGGGVADSPDAKNRGAGGIDNDGGNVAPPGDEMGATIAHRSGTVFEELQWLREPLIRDIFQHHVAIGDVQTCLAIASALASSGLYQADTQHRPRRARRRRHQRQHGHLCPLPFSASMFHEWHVWYISLLSKLQLWATANAVIVRSGDPRIRNMNRNGTYYKFRSTLPQGVGLSESSAGTAPGANGGGAHAKSGVRCAICDLPVRGSFVWCQGCGHGGHADHLYEYFVTHGATECPAGCGHVCVLEFSSEKARLRRGVDRQPRPMMTTAGTCNNTHAHSAACTALHTLES